MRPWQNPVCQEEELLLLKDEGFVRDRSRVARNLRGVDAMPEEVESNTPTRDDLWGSRSVRVPVLLRGLEVSMTLVPEYLVWVCDLDKDVKRPPKRDLTRLPREAPANTVWCVAEADRELSRLGRMISSLQ